MFETQQIKQDTKNKTRNKLKHLSQKEKHQLQISTLFPGK